MKYWAVFCTFLAAGMLFDLYVSPKTTYIDYSFSVNGFSDPFPFANVPGMGKPWYIYYGVEHYIFVATFFLFWKATGNEVVKWFFFVQVVDLIDYLLFYNDAYFFIGQIPVSFNTVSFLVWVVLGLNLFWLWLQKRLA
jgi:hypothetical protein